MANVPDGPIVGSECGATHANNSSLAFRALIPLPIYQELDIRFSSCVWLDGHLVKDEVAALAADVLGAAGDNSTLVVPVPVVDGVRKTRLAGKVWRVKIPNRLAVDGKCDAKCKMLLAHALALGRASLSCGAAESDQAT